ncbi:MAG: hypothetical protein AAB654_06320, partial [Acidobacteriota bacterium]
MTLMVVSRETPARDHGVGVRRVLAQRPHVDHRLQPARRTVLRPHLHGLVADSLAARAHGHFEGHGGTAGLDAQVVEEHQVVVSVLVRFVKLLRGHDHVDFDIAAEALGDRRRVLDLAAPGERDHRTGPLQPARRDAHHRIARRYPIKSDLDAPVRVQPDLEGLKRADSGVAVLRHFAPAHHHPALLQEHAHAFRRHRGVQVAKQSRNARRSGRHTPERAFAGGVVASGEGEVAVGIDEHPLLRSAEKRERERQRHRLGVVVAQIDS